MRATGEDTTGMEITLPREQHTRYNELTGSRATIVKFILKPTRVFGHGTMDDGRACGGRISSMCDVQSVVVVNFIPTAVQGDPIGCRTGNGIEGASGCTS